MAYDLDYTGPHHQGIELPVCTSRDKFNTYFEEHTGWEPSDYPNKSYVEDLWDFWQAGCDSND